jgi:hypothetical protein
MAKPVDEHEIKPGQVYRHFKHGALYEVICVATHSETDELHVVYKNPEGRCFLRPLEIFADWKDLDGQRVKRFALVRGASEAASNSQESKPSR